MADYKTEVDKRFDYIFKDNKVKDKIKNQQASLEGLVRDKYKKDGFKDITIDKDIKERAAYTVAYQTAATQEIEKRYDSIQLGKNVDINSTASVAGYVRELLGKSGNSLYKAVSKLSNDEDMLDAFATVAATSDGERHSIEEQIKAVKNGKGDSRFINMAKEVAKQGEIQKAKDAIYSGATKGIKNTEKEVQYSAAMGLIENARTGYMTSVNPYARQGPKLEREVDNLSHKYMDAYNRAPLEHRL